MYEDMLKKNNRPKRRCQVENCGDKKASYYCQKCSDFSNKDNPDIFVLCGCDVSNGKACFYKHVVKGIR